jgi:hypothetical protein
MDLYGFKKLAAYPSKFFIYHADTKDKQRGEYK